jgi:hypothetical protein
MTLDTMCNIRAKVSLLKLSLAKDVCVCVCECV